MSSVRTILAVALFALASACGAPPRIDTDAGTTDAGATDTSVVDDVPPSPDASCLCNCPSVPGLPRGEGREDWPSCGLPGSGETYARCCGI